MSATSTGPLESGKPYSWSERLRRSIALLRLLLQRDAARTSRHKAGWHQLHEAAWPEMVVNLQTAYSELSDAQGELQRRTTQIESERDLFQQVTASMSEALFLMDNYGKVKQVNPAAAALLGRAEADMVDKPFNEVWRSNDVPATPKALLDRAPTGTLTDLDVQLRVDGDRQTSLSVSGDLVRDKRGAITGVLVIARDITAKEVLLKEIHHRVKNNLQLISSMLRLQSRSLEDPQTIQVLREGQDRIRSMARIHEKLYETEDLARIDFGQYTRDLVSDLLQSYRSDVRPVVEVDEGVFFGVDTAIPCGLIVNELVSNCFKYAFPDGRPGQIRIALHSVDQDQFALAVTDNGIGFPTTLDFRNTTSLGLRLVTSLVDQLGGTISLERNGGTTFLMRFPASAAGKGREDG